MITLRTDAKHPDFTALVSLLDADLKERDGEDHAFYAQFNTIGALKYTMVAHENNVPIGCGALKYFDAETMEVKRMFVLPNKRGKGVASQILHALELWAVELGMKKCVLETGMNQPEAIRLYTKNGYVRIPNYGQYQEVENSVCFLKRLGNPQVVHEDH